MKRNNVFRLFVVAIVLVLVGLNRVSAQSRNYAYKDELMNDLLMTRTVYRYNNGDDAILTQCVKKEYTYDAFDRIKTQCISRWNSIESCWDRESVYIYNYDNGTYSVELLKYMPGNDRIISKRERCIYAIDHDRNILFSENYEWDKKRKNWILKNEIQRNDSIPLFDVTSIP